MVWLQYEYMAYDMTHRMIYPGHTIEMTTAEKPTENECISREVKLNKLFVVLELEPIIVESNDGMDCGAIMVVYVKDEDFIFIRERRGRGED